MENPLFDALSLDRIHSDRVFVEKLDGGVITHAQFFKRVSQIKNAFDEMGLTKGDCVALQAPKSVDALAIYVACVQAGIIFLPLSPSFTAIEVTYFLTDSQARLFICETVPDGELNIQIETLSPEKGSFNRIISRQSDVSSAMRMDMDDIVAILYTSGTTGRPKGVMLSQQNLLSNARVLIEAWQFTQDDILLHALPIYHTHGLFVAFHIALMSNAKILFFEKFDEKRVIENLPNATCLMGVPTFYTRLLKVEGFSKEAVANMRLFISGSAPLLQSTHQEFEARTGHVILERYGMTEISMCTSNPYNAKRRAGTVGVPLSGISVRVVDNSTGCLQSTNEIGNIEVKGPNVFRGYWRQPEKTNQEFTYDGYFITGDMGLIDMQGYLHIKGRDKDLIISGGLNIYPKEIEELLDKQIGVVESAVIAVPHSDLGETPMAVIVVHPETAHDMDEIRGILSTNLARYKHPSKFETIAELPRNVMGKVQKNLLRDRFKQP